jgi:hypothetical protein
MAGQLGEDNGALLSVAGIGFFGLKLPAFLLDRTGFGNGHSGVADGKI